MRAATSRRTRRNSLRRQAREVGAVALGCAAPVVARDERDEEPPASGEAGDVGAGDEIERVLVVAGRRDGVADVVEERRRLEEAARRRGSPCMSASWSKSSSARRAVWRACASSKLKRRPTARARPQPDRRPRPPSLRGSAGEIDDPVFRSPVSTATIDSSPRWRIAPSRITVARDDDLRAARLEPCAPLGDRLPRRASRRRGSRSGASSAARRRAPRRSR